MIIRPPEVILSQWVAIGKLLEMPITVAELLQFKDSVDPSYLTYMIMKHYGNEIK